MNLKSICQAGAILFVSLLSAFAFGQTVQTIEQYNQTLPLWGTTWAPGASAHSGYYPSFYTGFAIRSEAPERIHVRLARGNQTRVSVILDDQTLSDYLFDLAKRYEFYRFVTVPMNGSKGAPVILASEQKGKVLPQLQSYSQILESPNYGILAFVGQAKSGSQSAEAIYAKSLKTLKDLNPGRVFNLNLDLKNAFGVWQTQIQKMLAGKGDALTYFTKDSAQAALAIDQLLPGRINYTQKPSSEVLAKLATAANLAINGNQRDYMAAAIDLFKTLTGQKYAFKVLNQNGQFQNALQCPNETQCVLSYPEFTAIYPTGSVMSTVKDSNGNKIASFATPGLWPFKVSGGMKDVDNIRDEPYYGWIPKMDYEAIGNGFHNPAVRFGSIKDSVRETFGIEADHKTFWAVKRGGVSHGCSRLPAGHIWELRHIMPVENEKMTQVHYFGNNPQDFDVYDINGDGTPEVMGVEYLISYDLQGSSGLAQREGADLEVNQDRKVEFYKSLYGEKNVFTVGADGKFVFLNPSVSVQSHLDLKKKSVSSRMTLPGQFRLYEQTYEKDKIQFYVPSTTSGSGLSATSPEFKRLVQLMGRVRGCAPTSDKKECGEASFDQSVQKVLSKIQ